MSDELLEKVRAIIEPTAARYKTKPEHWIHGYDESLSYCYECAVKRIRQLRKLHPEKRREYIADGGWGSDGDSQAFCETCGCPLDNSYTDYACEQELDHFEESGFDHNDPSDCHLFIEILNCGSWSDELGERIQNLAQKVFDSVATAVVNP